MKSFIMQPSLPRFEMSSQGVEENTRSIGGVVDGLIDREMELIREYQDERMFPGSPSYLDMVKKERRYYLASIRTLCAELGVCPKPYLHRFNMELASLAIPGFDVF